MAVAGYLAVVTSLKILVDRDTGRKSSKSFLQIIYLSWSDVSYVKIHERAPVLFF